jgi:hypothetical protein
LGLRLTLLGFVALNPHVAGVFAKCETQQRLISVLRAKGFYFDQTGRSQPTAAFLCVYKFYGYKGCFIFRASQPLNLSTLNL